MLKAQSQTNYKRRYEASQQACLRRQALAQAMHENRVHAECLAIAMETLRQYAVGRNNAASRKARAEIKVRLAELKSEEETG